MGWPVGHSWQTPGLYGRSSVEPDLELSPGRGKAQHLAGTGGLAKK